MAEARDIQTSEAAEDTCALNKVSFGTNKFSLGIVNFCPVELWVRPHAIVRYTTST